MTWLDWLGVAVVALFVFFDTLSQRYSHRGGLDISDAVKRRRR